MARRSRLLAAGLGLALALVLAALAGTLARPADARAASATYANAVLDGDWPDPGVLRVRDSWWLATTTTVGGAGMPLLTSPDLVHWRQVSALFARPARWSTGFEQWAPEIYPRGSGFEVLYATRQRGGPLCVAAGTAPALTGPWSDRGPLVCQPNGAIDPTVTVDEQGAPYLLWKEDGNAVGAPARIWAKRLARDGLRVFGRKRLLLANGPSWEHGIVEAPSVVRRNGWYYLFFSGGYFGGPRCSYAMGVVRSRSLFGPFRENPADPFLSANRTWRCPGHGSLVQDGAGRWFVLYHAERAGRLPRQRSVLLDRVRWSHGWPTVNGGRGPSGRGVTPALLHG